MSKVKTPPLQRGGYPASTEGWFIQNPASTEGANLILCKSFNMKSFLLGLVDMWISQKTTYRTYPQNTGFIFN